MSYERRKVRVGKVVSDKMDKTVVVVYDWSSPHPIYKKAVRRQTKFYAHDADNSVKLGDTVRIVETRPYSKTKRWKVDEVLSSIEIAEVQPEEIQIDEDVMSAAATSAAQRGDDPEEVAVVEESEEEEQG